MRIEIFDDRVSPIVAEIRTWKGVDKDSQINLSSLKVKIQQQREEASSKSAKDFVRMAECDRKLRAIKMLETECYGEFN